MLAVLVKILSIIGIILLCLLVFLVFALLLLLFFPITYKIYGEKSENIVELQVKMYWLFGLLRINYRYPKPGNIIAKILCLTIYNSDNKPSDDANEDKQGIKSTDERGPYEPLEDTQAQKETQEHIDDNMSHENINKTEKNESEHQNIFQKNCRLIIDKFKKIKFKFKELCDKIMDILAHIKYYRDVLESENTKLLFKNVKIKLSKVLKNIRPRKIRANIEFGTGSPDTTGYALGLYSMVSPIWGQNVNVIPNFDIVILEGTIYIAGHITAFTILWNGLQLFFDKNLRIFISKIKGGRV